MINSAWSLNEVTAFLSRLVKQGYCVLDFGSHGACCEVDGFQVFRATLVGPDSYDVRYNEKVFPDV